MGERALASVKEITDIKPIAGADRIEVATIGNGWEVVVRKDEFKPGDWCVYHEIDSVLPVGIEAYDFLTKGKKPYRLRTARLRGQISQGLALPLSAFKASEIPTQAHLSLDSDLTDTLGVELYEEPLPKELENVAKGRFPYFIIMNQPQRIQNCANKVLSKPNERYEITKKYDGSYLAIWNYDGDIGFATKRVAYDATVPSIYRDTLEKTGWLKAVEHEFARNLAFIGEIAGPGIQRNRLGLPELDFFVFDVFDIERQRYYFHRDRMNILLSLADKVGNGFNPNHIPVVDFYAGIVDYGIENTVGFLDWVDTLAKELHTGEDGKIMLEGVVFKSLSDENFRFKVVSNQYLLDHGL